MKNLKNLSIIILAAMMFSSCGYNNMVGLDEGVKAQWSNVESAYQRRADLIPNLVATVKGYAEFEQETLTKVTEARARASSINVDINNLTPEAMAQFQQAQGQLNGALSRLLVTVEKYPDLKANQNFLELQAQLEGTENRIAVERKKFNDTVKEYNTYIRKFPQVMTASIFNFDQKESFKAEEGTDKAPKVEF